MIVRAAALGGLLLIGTAGYVAWGRAQAAQTAPLPAPEDAPTGGVAVPAPMSDAWELLKEAIMPTDIDLTNRNLRAFLRAIRFAEGTAGADGYRMHFGGSLFASFADHPRRAITARLGGREITSTAAGAYQFLERTWDDVRGSLPDFSPASQDMAAARLIRRRGALGDVYAGRFAEAVRKCAREWASLPGSPYGQPTKTLDALAGVYLSNGGFYA